MTTPDQNPAKASVATARDAVAMERLGRRYADLGSFWQVAVDAEVERRLPRPILVWLKTLPDGWREAALRHMNIETADVAVANAAEAVQCGLDWFSSPEKEAWIELFKALEKNNPLPPYPIK